jgi:hypothetical protein
MNTQRPILVTEENSQNFSSDMQSATSAPSGSGPYDPGMEARVAKLEAAVEHIQEDVRDIKGTLAQLAPVVNRMDGFLQATLPHLATKSEIAGLRTEMERRPTARQIGATVGLLIAVASLPFWPQWVALFRTVLG